MYVFGNSLKKCNKEAERICNDINYREDNSAVITHIERKEFGEI